MSDDGTERLWLVERTYDDKGLIVLAYATLDGTAVRRIERAPVAIEGMGGVTAAVDAGEGSVTAVEDDDRRERYAAEATRMADRHEPDDNV